MSLYWAHSPADLMSLDRASVRPGQSPGAPSDRRLPGLRRCLCKRKGGAGGCNSPWALAVGWGGPCPVSFPRQKAPPCPPRGAHQGPEEGGVAYPGLGTSGGKGVLRGRERGKGLVMSSTKFSWTATPDGIRYPWAVPKADQRRQGRIWWDLCLPMTLPPPPPPPGSTRPRGPVVRVGGDGRDSAWRNRTPGPHAHRTTARQAMDGLWTEARGQQKQSNDPHNNQHNLNTPTIG